MKTEYDRSVNEAYGKVLNGEVVEEGKKLEKSTKVTNKDVSAEITICGGGCYDMLKKNGKKNGCYYNMKGRCFLYNKELGLWDEYTGGFPGDIIYRRCAKCLYNNK